MANDVYHFHFLNELLPESNEEKAVFARENTAKLTGGAENGTFVIEWETQ